MRHTIGRWMLLVAVLVSVAECSRTSPLPATGPTPETSVLPPPTVQVSLVSPSPDAAASGLPAVAARLTVGAEIANVLPDPGAERLYVNDTAGRLYVLDSRNYQLQASLPVGSGPMTLDAPNHLLFVAREPTGREVAVVDTAALAVTAAIAGGYQVAVDSAGHRAFVGWAGTIYEPAGPGEVQVWDTRTFRRLGVIPHRGEPVYNPLRNEVYLRDDWAYVVDGKSLALTGVLLTEDLRNWNNCSCSVSHVAVDAKQDAIMVTLADITLGAGCGPEPPPVLLSAQSREPVTHTVTVLGGLGPSGDPLALPPEDGQVYAVEYFGRYQVYYSTLAYLVGGDQPSDYREGIYLGLYIPGTRVALSLDQPYILALDVRTWQPLGWITYEPIRLMDPVGQRLYAWEGSSLTVLTFTGGEPLPPASAEPWLPGKMRGWVSAVQVSPGFARDRTVFALLLDRGILRSTDGGETWVRLRGISPDPNWGATGYAMAVSPSYDQDHTLFFGAWMGDAQGIGVWKSTDGGDSWAPCWQGLRHLKVNRLAISPRYAEDQTIVAHCRYNLFWRGGGEGASRFGSRDGGASWQELPADSDLLPAAVPAPFAMPRSDGEQVAAAPSPRFASDHQAFALFTNRLYRSGDGGQTWEAAEDPRAICSEGRFTALAVGADEGERLALFLGDSQGQVTRLDPQEIAWTPAP